MIMIMIYIYMVPFIQQDDKTALYFDRLKKNLHCTGRISSTANLQPPLEDASKLFDNRV